MKFHSFAKINIGLRIVRKRPDGFHDIETLFQQIDLHDTMIIEPTHDGSIQISCSDLNCPADATNLAYKAADLLRRSVDNFQLGCRIHIIKRIPMGAGLGGGSSNAATTLTALNQLFSLQLSSDDLMKLGLQLGSDVPFFIHGGFVFGQGRGELLTPVHERLQYTGLLILPDIHISTARVYNNLNLNLTNRENFANFSGFIPRIKETSRWRKRFDNDLTTVVFKEHPSFIKVLDLLYNFGAFYAHMSGSGSSLFGLFETKELATKAEHKFKKLHKALVFKPLF